MMNIFGWTIVRKSTIEELQEKKNYYKEKVEYMKFKSLMQEKPTLHCGYKSCQFSTTDPTGLKIHRARIHRNK